MTLSVSSCLIAKFHVLTALSLALFFVCSLTSFSLAQSSTGNAQTEYIWFEAENMRGFGTKPTGEPIQNPSWMNLPKAKAPGWGMNGPGVSAEWSQGGESEWNSAAASADESAAKIYQDVEIPRAGNYKVWVRYADWANRSETFVIRVAQGAAAREQVSASPPLRIAEVFHHEFGNKDVIDVHDEVSMYWGWSFAWDSAELQLAKGPARISIEIEKPAEARRHIDCLLLTNDLAYVPDGRRKPDFAATRYLRDWSSTRTPLSSLTQQSTSPSAFSVPGVWKRPTIAGRDFFMPWNISTEFWKLYDKPPAERPLYPFNAEPIEEFVAKYKGARDVPLFNSKLIVPVIYINNLAEYLKEGSAFLRYLRETKVAFAILINYGSAALSAEDGQAAWKLLTGEFKDQFLGWMSGESVGYVWEQAPAQLKVSASMSRQELLEAQRVFYTNAIADKWAAIFHTDTGAMWDKLIPAQSTSSTSFAHALSQWGVRLLGIETAAVQPMFAMRTAFTRGAARQYGGNFLYYHAANFGDTATAFTKQQNFAGPDNFFHSRYGTTMGPSLSWYRKSYYFYYMSGAAGIYLEQGFDQFFKPGPGDHEFQLNPLGHITDEFMRFAERHPDRGTPYTPVAFLLDPAHGWDMTDYPQWPFEVSQVNRSDRALRELFGIAYFPGLVVEGEPATGDRQAFVNGIFGDIFDVLVAADVESPTSKVESSKLTVQIPKSRTASRQTAAKTKQSSSSERQDWNYEGSNANAESNLPNAPSRVSLHSTSSLPRHPVYPLESYRMIVAGGKVEWSPEWIEKLSAYVRAGGTLVLNSAQLKGLTEDLVGLHLTGATAEADNARCLSPGEAPQHLGGQMFRYEKILLKGARAFITTDSGDPLVTVNQVGKGSVIFASLPDLLGEDERMTPFAAHMLAHVFSRATPIEVSGDVEYLLNRNENGWIVTLFNNNGVFKPQQGLAQVDRKAYVNVRVSLRGQPIQKAVDWITDKELDLKGKDSQNTVTATIAPGGVSIIELRTTLK
jgi:hypothetical protein